jgi:hypothetical protein
VRPSALRRPPPSPWFAFAALPAYDALSTLSSALGLLWWVRAVGGLPIEGGVGEFLFLGWRLDPPASLLHSLHCTPAPLGGLVSTLSPLTPPATVGTSGVRVNTSSSSVGAVGQWVARGGVRIPVVTHSGSGSLVAWRGTSVSDMPEVTSSIPVAAGVAIWSLVFLCGLRPCVAISSRLPRLLGAVDRGH